ncbi:hypothetical protein BsWGS_19770 [Bradybaena similaris]
MKPHEIHRRILQQYGDVCIVYRKVYKWVHTFENGCTSICDESKRQSLEWWHTLSPSKKKFKFQPFDGKVLLMLFWDMNGPLVEHYHKKGETVNSARYSTLLEDELKPAIQSRR